MPQKTTLDITRVSELDLSQEFIISNAQNTPLSSLLLGRGKNYSVSDWLVREKIKTLSTGSASGGKKEGADAPATEKSSFSYVDNLLEIFTKATEISGTVGAVHGSSSKALGKEMDDRLSEMKYDLEIAFLNGTKKNEDETGGRKMNGLLNMVEAEHVIDATAGFTKDKILDALQAMYYSKTTNGELWAFAHPSVKRKITALYVDAYERAVVDLVPGMNQGVGISIEKIFTDFGIVNLVMVDAMPTSQLLIANLDYITMPELRPAHFEALAKTGDADKGQVITEVSIMTAPQALAKIINIA